MKKLECLLATQVGFRYVFSLASKMAIWLVIWDRSKFDLNLSYRDHMVRFCCVLLVFYFASLKVDFVASVTWSSTKFTNEIWIPISYWLSCVISSTNFLMSESSWWVQLLIRPHFQIIFQMHPLSKYLVEHFRLIRSVFILILWLIQGAIQSGFNWKLFPVFSRRHCPNSQFSSIYGFPWS